MRKRSATEIIQLISSILFFLIFLFIAAPSGTGERGRLTNEFLPNPLEPPDTSSPRATLSEFMRYMNESYKLIMQANEENAQSSGLRTPEETLIYARKAEEIFNKGVSCLDLSNIPTAIRKGQGYESALKLKEIFDRVGLPPLADIPDSVAVEEQHAQSIFKESYRWRIPQTDIVIERIEEGPQQGQFLFASSSVSRLPEFYLKVKDNAYSDSENVTPNYYEFYIATPGDLLPPKWGNWLPVWSRKLIVNQTVWQWLALFLCIAWSFLILRNLRRSMDPLQAGISRLSKYRRLMINRGALIIVTLTLNRIVGEHINLTGWPLYVIGSFLTLINWFAAATMAMIVGKYIAENIIKSPQIDPNGIQASYFRAVFSLGGILAGAAILVYGLSSVGVALAPLLAGVGIGGLAIALAARPSLENIIGSFTIFADHPYRVGQRIVTMGQDGHVESIGLRSTRIRLLTGHLTTIPNEKVINSEIENIGERPYIRRKFDISLKLGTSPEKLNRAVQIVRDILSVPELAEDETHPNLAINSPNFPPRVFFNDIRRDAMNILVLYWYSPPNRWEYLEHAHWINIQIVEQFNAEGIHLALPAQSLSMEGGTDFDILDPADEVETAASDDVRPDVESARPLSDGQSDAEGDADHY